MKKEEKKLLKELVELFSDNPKILKLLLMGYEATLKLDEDDEISFYFLNHYHFNDDDDNDKCGRGEGLTLADLFKN
jgi:hypothetical protein